MFLIKNNLTKKMLLFLIIFIHSISIKAQKQDDYKYDGEINMDIYRSDSVWNYDFIVTVKNLGKKNINVFYERYRKTIYTDKDSSSFIIEYNLIGTGIRKYYTEEDVFYNDLSYFEQIGSCNIAGNIVEPSFEAIQIKPNDSIKIIFRSKSANLYKNSFYLYCRYTVFLSDNISYIMQDLICAGCFAYYRIGQSFRAKHIELESYFKVTLDRVEKIDNQNFIQKHSKKKFKEW